MSGTQVIRSIWIPPVNKYSKYEVARVQSVRSVTGRITDNITQGKRMYTIRIVFEMQKVQC